MTRVPAHVSRDDLQSAGLTALVKAARAYEPDRGVPFTRYAASRIRGAILDELRQVDWASRSVRRRGRDLDAARSALATAWAGHRRTTRWPPRSASRSPRSRTTTATSPGPTSCRCRARRSPSRRCS
ncbi:sigma factor [Nocardioides ginkgobilobae]